MRRALLAALGAATLLPAGLASARTTVPRGWMGMVASTELVAHPSRVPGQFRAMSRAGVESVKAEFAWAQIEPAQGEFDWTRPDAIVGNAAQQGFSVLPTVLQAPGWEAGQGPGIQQPSDPDDYADFMVALVHRYGPHGAFWRANPDIPKRPVRAWEIWNEPELYHWWKPPWRKPYAELLHRAHDAIKGADPGAKIVLAGLTYTAWSYLNQLYGAGVGPDYDIASVHPYTSQPKNVVTTVRNMRRVMRRHGDADKPIWVTELAWTSGKGKTPEAKEHNQPTFLNSTPKGQARLLARGYRALARNRTRYGVGRVFWYTWLTRDRSRIDPFDWSGLVVLRGGRAHAKPALAAYRQVARQLRP